MSAPAICALDLELNELMQAEGRRNIMPLALRRFQECWDNALPTEAMRHATAQVVKDYRSRFPSASPVFGVPRLCEVIGVRLRGLRPPSRIRPSYPDSRSSNHVGHSGSVRFLRDEKPLVVIPEEVNGYRARMAAAHELGHVLVHKRGDDYDPVTTRLPSSSEEEAIAEYAARLLLIPTKDSSVQNLAEDVVRWARHSEVTIHAAACRLGDPDHVSPQLRGVVLWKLSNRVGSDSILANRLTPAWHLCPNAFIPIGKCSARAGSLVAELAEGYTPASDIRAEGVQIGSLRGNFRVHGYAWGSVSAGTRLALSVFEELEDAQCNAGAQRRPYQPWDPSLSNVSRRDPHQLLLWER